MSFDYAAFENDLLAAIEGWAKLQLDKKDEIYIMAVECYPWFTTLVQVKANTFSYLEEISKERREDYAYYKFCEEEWGLGERLEKNSKALQTEYNRIETDYDDETADRLKREHSEKIITSCKNVMIKFRETETFKLFPKLYLTVYVSEFFSSEERISIFKEINGAEAAAEYSAWL